MKSQDALIHLTALGHVLPKFDEILAAGIDRSGATVQIRFDEFCTVFKGQTVTKDGDHYDAILDGVKITAYDNSQQPNFRFSVTI